MTRRPPRRSGSGGNPPVRRTREQWEARVRAEAPRLEWRRRVFAALTVEEQDALGPCPTCGRALGENRSPCATCGGVGR